MHRTRSPHLLVLALASAIFAPPAVHAQGVDVPTFHYTQDRLGWNARETALTYATVRPATFGKLWTNPLDGGVPGSPVYLSDVDVAGAKHSVVYACTDQNSVFAVDAKTGKTLWSRPHLAQPLNDAQFTGSWFGRGAHGILGTPVIDTAAGTLYCCTIRASGLRQYYEVWALDVHTGAARPGWPVKLHGSYKGSPFTPGQVMQRGALSLVNGWVYVPFGGRWDTPPWRGWVMGINTAEPTAPQRAFSSSPVTDGAGIWSGGGVAADADGSLYAGTGNGEFDVNDGGNNLAESVVRLKTDGSSFGFDGSPSNFYTPANFKFMDDQDEDLGGATPLVLPDQPDTSTPHLLFMCGKDGVTYLINRDNLGGIGGEVYKERTFSDPAAVYHEGIRSTSVYFDAGEAGRIALIAGDQAGPNDDHGMLALKLAPQTPGGPMRFKRLWTQKEDLNGPTSPIGTSNGAADPIVWVVETNDGDNPNLRAYKALTGEELYNSRRTKGRDSFPNAYRFTSPIATDGRVFIGSAGIVCFGQLQEVGK